MSRGRLSWLFILVGLVGCVDNTEMNRFGDVRDIPVAAIYTRDTWTYTIFCLNEDKTVTVSTLSNVFRYYGEDYYDTEAPKIIVDVEEGASPWIKVASNKYGWVQILEIHVRSVSDIQYLGV